MLHVLITGAAGTLGSRIRHHRQALGWPPSLLDRDACGDNEAETVDLADFRDDRASRFAGVDTVLHLAGDPTPRAPWNSAVRNNIDATHNVVEASWRAGVRRVVFASSNWVLAGHRFETTPLDAETEPYPVNPYGASKLVASASAVPPVNFTTCPSLLSASAIASGIMTICPAARWVGACDASACGSPTAINAKASKNPCSHPTLCGSASSISYRIIAPCAGVSTTQ